MNENVAIEIGTALPHQIEEHLIQCSSTFTPPLAERIDIKTYAGKIYKHAITIEAWENELLVGLIAMYENAEKQTAFITNVSVLQSFMGKGIASELLERCFVKVQVKGIKLVELEVHPNNNAAISFYKKHQFNIVKSDSNAIVMMREFKTIS